MATRCPFLQPHLSQPSLRRQSLQPALFQPLPPLQNSQPSLRRQSLQPALFQPLPPLQNSLRFNPNCSKPVTRALFSPSPSPNPISPISPSLIHLEGSDSFGFINKDIQAILFSLAAFCSWNLMGAIFNWVALKYKDKYVKNCQLLDCLKNPFRVLLVAYLLLKVAFLLCTSVLGQYEKYLPELRRTILLLSGGKFLYNSMDMVLVWSFPSDKDRKMMQERTNIHMIFSILLFCGLFLATLEIWGISGHNALVTSGIMCAATSFALKDVFENFLKGLWLRFLEPYSIGDYIMVKSEKLFGKVIDIRLTSITIIDQKTGIPVVVPYTSLSQKSIYNVSRATHVVVEEKFTIAIEDLDKVDSIIKSSNQMLRSDFSAEDYCILSGVGESGIELTVFCRVKKMDNDMGEVHVRTIRQSVLFRIASIILSSGATFGKKEKKKKEKNEDD